MASRDRSRSPLRTRPVAWALTQAALDVVVEHERDLWLEHSERVLNRQRDTIGMLRVDVVELRQRLRDTMESDMALVQRQAARIRDLELEVATLELNAEGHEQTHEHNAELRERVRELEFENSVLNRLWRHLVECEEAHMTRIEALEAEVAELRARRAPQ